MDDEGGVRGVVPDVLRVLDVDLQGGSLENNTDHN